MLRSIFRAQDALSEQTALRSMRQTAPANPVICGDF